MNCVNSFSDAHATSYFDVCNVQVAHLREISSARLRAFSIGKWEKHKLVLTVPTNFRDKIGRFLPEVKEKGSDIKIQLMTVNDFPCSVKRVSSTALLFCSLRKTRQTKRITYFVVQPHRLEELLRLSSSWNRAVKSLRRLFSTKVKN